MNKESIKTIGVFLLVYFSVKLLFIDYLNLDFIGYILIGLILGLTAYFVYTYKTKINLFLFVSLFIFLISALLSRSGNQFSSNRVREIRGVWYTPDTLGTVISFDFYSDDEVSVDSNQSEELVYQYEVSNEELVFLRDDTVRFNWNISFKNENNLTLIDDTSQKLLFIRE